MIDRLSAHSDPAVRALAGRELSGATADEAEVVTSPLVTALLAGPPSPPRDPYRKWTGAHWRLLALSELGIRATSPPIEPLAEEVAAWLARSLRREPVVVAGLPRAHGSVQGNAIGALSRIGWYADPRVADAAAALVRWQWPDGGWNCDTKASGRRSSFHETLGAMWGLFEYGRASGDPAAASAARAAAELLLEHHVVYRADLSAPIRPQWLKPAYPAYWHYGLVPALVALDRMGLVHDPRTERARAALAAKRSADGWWVSEHQWWNPPGHRISPEVVSWPGLGEPNPFLTISALKVLGASGT